MQPRQQEQSTHVDEAWTVELEGVDGGSPGFSKPHHLEVISTPGKVILLGLLPGMVERHFDLADRIHRAHLSAFVNIAAATGERQII